MKLKRQVWAGIIILLLASLACNAVVVQEKITLSIYQDEPVGVSCGNNTWTETPDNGVNVNLTDMVGSKDFTGFVYELKEDQIYQYVYRDGVQIDWSTFDVGSDELVKVQGTIPGLLYDGHNAELEFSMYLLVCNGKLYYQDFQTEPLKQQQA